MYVYRHVVVVYSGSFIYMGSTRQQNVPESNTGAVCTLCLKILSVFCGKEGFNFRTKVPPCHILPHGLT